MIIPSPTTHDIFAKFRVKDPDAAQTPFDKITNADELRDFESRIRQISLATSSGDPPKKLTQSIISSWANQIANSLCCEPNFQTIAIDHWLDHGWNKGARPVLDLNRGWLIGQHLPWFYHLHKTFDEGRKSMDKVLVEAIKGAWDHMNFRLAECDKTIRQSATSVVPTPVKTESQSTHMVGLYQLVQVFGFDISQNGLTDKTS